MQLYIIMLCIYIYIPLASPFGDEPALEVCGSGGLHLYMLYCPDFARNRACLLFLAVATPRQIGISKAFGGYTTGGGASRDRPMGQSPIPPKSRIVRRISVIAYH